MRLLKLEIKRVLKTRMTQIILLAALLFSALLAYIPATFVYSSYIDEDGNEVVLQGLDAIRREKEITGNISGDITSKTISYALKTYQDCLKEYGVQNASELPDGVYEERIAPVSPLFHCIREAYADPNTGFAADLAELDPNDMEEFYTACQKHLNSIMKMEQKTHPAAQNAASDLYSRVKTPFTYRFGITSDAMDYETILMFLILLCCTVICAPVFSAEYQTGGDSILRCTKYGRNRLAITKIVSAVIISAGCLTLCSAVWMGITGILFGKAGMSTSMQIIFSVISLPNMNMGQLQLVVAAVSGLVLLASICFTLFVSANSNNNVQAMALSLLFCILPIITYVILPENISNFVNCILPSGGIGLQNSFLYDLIDLKFLNAGSISIWTPYSIVFMSLVEIPLFIWFTIRCYKQHAIK